VGETTHVYWKVYNYLNCYQMILMLNLNYERYPLRGRMRE